MPAVIAPSDQSADVAITIGDIHDYDTLSRFHYRAARPATISQVLIARDTLTSDLSGVLVISRPALNGPWREHAWPGQYTRNHAALNRDLRVISRLVVEPRYRGQGIGRALVAAYLDSPLTIRTECIAAMGRYSHIFTAAGMRQVPCPPSRRVTLLLSRLAALHIHTWQLADPDALIAHLHRSRGSHTARLTHALRVFANAHRDTRASRNADLHTLITLAARRLSTTPAAFIAEHNAV